MGGEHFCWGVLREVMARGGVMALLWGCDPRVGGELATMLFPLFGGGSGVVVKLVKQGVKGLSEGLATSISEIG